MKKNHPNIRFFMKWGFAMVASAFLFGNNSMFAFGGTRDAMYAGTWYPGTQHDLTAAVDQYIDNAVNPEFDGRVIGLISPHAGYVYSAAVAAHGYKAVRGLDVDVVILMGNAHREAFHGAAIDEVSSYRNPMGVVEVDTELAKELARKAPSVHINSIPHQKEHSLEIQLPFLQRALKPGFKIVPILFGYEPDGAEDQITEILANLLKDRSFLLVASTDLTHYPAYSDAKRIDEKTIEIISSMNDKLLKQHENSQLAKGTTNLACVLCAGTATRSVMSLCKKFGAERGLVLKYANSGDVAAGDRSQVVGYGSVAFVDEDLPGISAGHDRNGLSRDEEKKLLGFARFVINEYVHRGTTPEIKEKGRLSDIKRGVFVTLHKGENLRGCIGYIEPITSCLEAVRDNAVSACARDPRFPPVQKEELNDLSIEISVLTPPEPIESWEDIKLGTHGIILEKGAHRSVFLPQVAPEQGWDLETTLMYLSLKAGLPADGWKDARFKVFEAQVFNEEDLGRQQYTP